MLIFTENVVQYFEDLETHKLLSNQAGAWAILGMLALAYFVLTESSEVCTSITQANIGMNDARMSNFMHTCRKMYSFTVIIYFSWSLLFVYYFSIFGCMLI